MSPTENHPTPSVIDREGDWLMFEDQVRRHIKFYANPQYHNETGDDQVENWDALDCINAITRYTSRAGRNARGPREQLRDCLKIAHYAQLAYDKFKKELRLGDMYPYPPTGEE
jgi:hypothetical protein